MSGETMQELASKYVGKEITMTQYCDGINRLMKESKNQSESTVSKVTGNYKNDELEKMR